MGKTRFPRRDYSKPLRIIDYIIAITTILGGLFILTPLVAIPVPGAADPEIVKHILSRPGIIALGVVAIAAAGMQLFGLIKKHLTWHSAGLFLNILVRLYAILAGWLVQGEVPLPFSADVVLLTVVVVLWISVRIDTWTKKNRPGVEVEGG